MKKSLSIVLSLIIMISILSALPFSAHADALTQGKCGEDVYYLYDDMNHELNIYGYGEMDNYYDESESPFAFNTDIETLTIDDGVSSIGDYAFYGCTGLTEIARPGDLRYIGENSFCYCTGLTDILITSGVNEVNFSAFAYCTGLKTVTIENGLTELKEFVFDGCTNLTRVEVPASVTEISEYTFYNASNTFTLDAPCYSEVAQSIVEGTDRKWVYEHAWDSGKVVSSTAATYTLRITCLLCGEHYTVKRNRTTNTLIANGKTKTLKYNSLRKRNLSVKRSDAVSVSKANGTVTYAKSSGSRKISVDKKTGKITVKKGLKKGKYKVKLKVMAAGTKTRKSKTVTVTVTIIVK